MGQPVGEPPNPSVRPPWFAAGEEASGLALAGDVHLWSCWLDDVDDPALLRDYEALLTPGELASRARFHFERDRHRHLVTRALVRTVLSAYVPRPAADWRFGVNDFGKPHLLPPDEPDEPDATSVTVPSLSFNLSHSGRAVVLALADGRALGVDVEGRFPKDAQGIARNFFAPAEADALDALPESERPARFLRLWTLKESYLKALGTGLSTPLDRIRFDACADGILDLHEPALADDARRWHFASFERRGHRLAVCVERRDVAAPRAANPPQALAPDGTAVPRLVCRECVPLRHATPWPEPAPRFFR